jgi:mono/diheme cytochrome c family protein
MRHVIFTILLLGATPTLADERVPPVADETALKECGACHMAYQPQFLPAEAWRGLFADLSDHFGEDASLSEPDRDRILDYYIAHAGRDIGSEPPLRITELDWWVREHREVKEATWSSAAVRFKGNCAACHKQAEQGIYEDD